MFDYTGDNFVVPDEFDDRGDDDEESFEPVTSKKHRIATPQLGPPITTDERMSQLPAIHRMMVDEFVERAKELADKIRKSKGLRYPFFTEANFREMAIRWTVRLSDMREIDGIRPDVVDRYGERFIPLILDISNHYEQMMRDNNDKLAAEINPIVVEISDDDVAEDGDDDNEDEDDGLDDIEKQAISRAQQQSRYFQNQDNASKSHSRNLPWDEKSRGASTVAKRSSSKAGRGSFPRKSGGRRSSGRKSNGSAGSGVSKKSRYSSGSRASSTGTGSKQTGLMGSFAKKGGRGGGSGGGIGMMPT